MKLPKTIFMGVISLLFLFVFSQGVFAATPPDTSAKVLFTEDAAGALRLEYVPDLDFGTHKFSFADSTYEAVINGSFPVPYVRVTDERGPSNANGWNVQVSAGAFTSSASHTLNGAEIHLKNGVVAQQISGLTFQPPIVGLSIDIVIPTAENTSVLVVKADPATNGTGAGRGTWDTTWDHSVSDSSPETNDNVTLYVPGNGIMETEEYTSILTWTLGNTP